MPPSDDDSSPTSPTATTATGASATTDATPASAPAASSFTFCIDGIGDPFSGRLLTRLISEKAGLTRSRCDPAGMWVSVDAATGAGEESGPKPVSTVTEAWADSVVDVGRLAGFELRDRVGSTFIASATRDEIAHKLALEWKSRFATGLVFLLPAIVLHYLTPTLAQGSRLIPWMIEAALVGWSILAAGWPVIFQGWLALTSLRMTPDLFGSVALIISFVAALLGGWGEMTPVAPFQACAFILICITLQRAILWGKADRLDGLSHRLPPSHGALMFALVLAVVGGPISGGTSCMLAMLVAVPAMIGPLSINRLLVGHPGTGVLPVLMFEVLLLAAPHLSGAGDQESAVLLKSGMIEGAFAFNLLITILYGWSLGAKRTKTKRLD